MLPEVDLHGRFDERLVAARDHDLPDDAVDPTSDVLVELMRPHGSTSGWVWVVTCRSTVRRGYDRPVRTRSRSRCGRLAEGPRAVRGLVVAMGVPRAPGHVPPPASYVT